MHSINEKTIRKIGLAFIAASFIFFVLFYTLNPYLQF